MSAYFLGTSPVEALGNSPRFFYAIRKNDDGEIFFIRSDQTLDKDSIELNIPGPPSETFEDFEPGVDFFEGVTDDHEPNFKNLVWTQYTWDNRSILYYINDDGQLVQRINQSYVYRTGISG